MQQAFKAPPGAAGARVVAAELLDQLLLAVDNPQPALDLALGWEPAPALAGRLKRSAARGRDRPCAWWASFVTIVRNRLIVAERVLCAIGTRADPRAGHLCVSALHAMIAKVPEARMADSTTTQLTITIDSERLERLRRRAVLLGFTTDEYVRKGIDALLIEPDEQFAELLHEMLVEDAELFLRLA
jgi:hypothetical protein